MKHLATHIHFLGKTSHVCNEKPQLHATKLTTMNYVIVEEADTTDSCNYEWMKAETELTHVWYSYSISQKISIAKIKQLDKIDWKFGRHECLT